MHPEVVNDQAGTCPICKMKLVPIRLDTVWSCPVHEVIAAPRAGRCPICGRELVRVTMGVSWRCTDRPDAERLEPGICSDGTPARVKYTARPHGNHNPQHGGQFFMAPDNWHHLEGVHPRAGLFRLHVYDDYSKPLSAEQLRRVSGRVTTLEGDLPLKIARGRDFLEAHISAVALPAQITAQVRFTSGAAEYRFDFTFTTYSDPALRPRETNVVSGVVSRTESAAADVGLKADTTYGKFTYGELLAQLRERSREISSIIDRGAFAELYVPAFAAKDLALGIEARAADAATPRRAEIEAATSRLVRAAWMLDGAGDLGNRSQITDAYARFVAAAAEMEAALAPLPR